jgi:hypothetical protein
MRTVVLLLAMLAPAVAAAQGLGDIAARERQKREDKPPAAPAKAYSNRDLPEESRPPADVPATPEGTTAEASAASGDSPPPADPSSAGAAPPGDKAAAPDPLDEDRQERRRLEARWRERFAKARERLANAEADSWHEVVRTEFYEGIPVPMRVQEQVETEELRQARRALADLEEEFRRTGLPPGWARH